MRRRCQCRQGESSVGQGVTVMLSSLTSDDLAESLAVALSTYVPGCVNVTVTTAVPSLTCAVDRGAKIALAGPRHTIQETVSSTGADPRRGPRPGSTI